jgi:hypothetical protein
MATLCFFDAFKLMKNIFLKFTLILLLTASFLFHIDLLHAAADKKFTIVCDRNAALLSNQFAKRDHWSHQSLGWWSSWAHAWMSGKLFVGGLRAVGDTLPADRNPALLFSRIAIHISEGAPEVDCIYSIHNPDLFDRDEGLYMVVHLFSATHCCLDETSPQDTVQCE